MKSYQFFTEDGRGGTMLCDDETLEDAVSELNRRFKNVVRVQIGKEVWVADNDQKAPTAAASSPPAARESGA